MRPPQPSRMTEVVWTTLFVLVVSTLGLIVGSILIEKLGLEGTNQRIGVVLWSGGWLVILSFFCVNSFRLNPGQLGWRGASYGYLVVGGVLGLICMPALGTLAAKIRQLYQGTDHNPQLDHLLLVDASTTQWVVMAILVTVVVPFAEELLYRGVFFGCVERATNAWVAILMSAALFRLVHYDLANSIGTGLLGLVCGLLRARTGSIMPAVAVHMSFNALGFWVMVTYAQASGS